MAIYIKNVSILEACNIAI